jgi:hypothetical protein
MRSPTVRKQIDTSAAALSPLAGRQQAEKNEQNSTPSNADSISSRSSPDHSRTPSIQFRSSGSTSLQLGRECGLFYGLLAGWLLWGEGGLAVGWGWGGKRAHRALEAELRDHFLNLASSNDT